MGLTNKPLKARIITGSQEFTGGIDKIQALGHYSGSSVLEEVRFGDVTVSSVVSASHGTIELPNGSHINGPIVYVKGNTGDFLVYYR